MKYLIYIIFLLIPTLSQAQAFDVGISWLNQSFTFPSKYIFEGSPHPGFSISSTIQRKKENKSTQHWNFEVGYFHHAHFQNALYLTAGIGYPVIAKNKFEFILEPRLGYLHTFYPNGVFTFEKGSYQRKAGGRANAIVGLSTQLQYQLLDHIPIKVVGSMIVTIDGPFAIDFGVPVVPRTFFQLGLKYQFRKS